MLLDERRSTLDRLASLLDNGAIPNPPEGRNWKLELWAELAIDASVHANTDEALSLASAVLSSEDAAAAPLAVARASWARGRALAWAGTDATASEGDRELTLAAERFGTLGASEWQGYTKVWHGHTVHYENGRPAEARALIEEGLDLLSPDSPRRATGLVFLADVLIETGQLEAAEDVLIRSYQLANQHADLKSRAYATWTTAHLAAARDDPHTTERLLGEVERDSGDWFESHLGLYFLTEAAELLDRVGLDGPARRYLRLALGRGTTSNDYVVQARALLVGRSGNPVEAEALLQEVVRSEWIEKRLRWRNTLLLAWVKLRAGSLEDAGRIAARALEQVVSCGGLVVALTSEPLLVRALAPHAHEAGSVRARQLLLGDRRLLVRLFGELTVTGPDGAELPLPAGMPGQLVRMLAVNEYGLPVDYVLETFFPETSASRGRHRLRQVLTRLRTAAGEIVIRDGETLKLVPAWVDVREFFSLARQAQAARDNRAAQLAHAALALAARGPLLPADPYSAWADLVRDQQIQSSARLQAILDDARSPGPAET
jgi:tetratricopeptide (TPR) repeat protein